MGKEGNRIKSGILPSMPTSCQKDHPLVFSSNILSFYVTSCQKDNILLSLAQLLCSGLKMMELELHEQQICLSLFLSLYVHIQIPCLPPSMLYIRDIAESKHTPDEHERPRCKNRQRTMSRGLISTLNVIATRRSWIMAGKNLRCSHGV